MKSWTFKYIGEKSGLDFFPQTDTTIFSFKVLLNGKQFDMDIKVANIDISKMGGRQEILKFLYDCIGDMIFRNEEKLKSTTYVKIGDTLEKE